MNMLYSKRASKVVSLFIVFAILLGFFTLNIQKVKAEGTSSVQNPGFEEVADGKPVSWSFSSSMASLNTDPQYVRSGSNSTKIVDTSTTSGVLIRSVPISIQSGTIYEASVYCYGVSVAPQLYLEFYNSSNTRIGYVISTLSTLSGWSKLTSSGMSPEGTAYAKLLLYTSTSQLGEAYFDDASFGLAPSILQNPGFEEIINGKPVNWTIDSSMASLNIDPQYVRSGLNSVKIADTSTTSPVVIRSAPIPVRSGTIYDASIFCYRISGDTQLYLEFYNSSNTRISFMLSSSSALATWGKIEASGIAPEGTAYAKLLLYTSVSGQGEAYFDDASIDIAPTILQNPSFEIAENNMPAGWICYNTSDVSLSTEKSYDGITSLKIIDQSFVNGVTVRSKPIPVIPGNAYEASVYSFNESGLSDLYFEYYDSKGTRIYVGTDTNDTTGEWKKISVRKEAPDNAVYASIVLYSSTTNVCTAYFDNVALTQMYKTLLNCGFEDVNNNKPVGWNFSQPDSSEASTSMTYEGSYSLKLADTNGSSAISAQTGKILAQEDNVMKVSVYSYNEGGSSILSLRYYDTDDNLLKEATAVNDSISQWKLLEVENTVPYNTSYMTVCLSSSDTGTGNVFFDNASLVMLSDAPVHDFPLLVTGHPRLYFTEADIPALREKASSTTPSTTGVKGNDLWKSLESDAKEYMQETGITVTYYNNYKVTYSLPLQQPEHMSPPPGFTAGEYPYWTELARAIEQRIEALSLAYCVTGNSDYADRAKSYTLSVCNWDVWNDPIFQAEIYNNRRFLTNLDTAHLTLGVSAAYDMLYNILSEDERAIIEIALESKGLNLLFEDVLVKQDHNKQMLRASALGTGAMALLGKDPNAAKYLTRATTFYKWWLDRRMNSGEQEGFGYTNYCMENLMRSIDQLARTTGERDLIEHPFINDFIVNWALYSLVPGGVGLPNISDSYLLGYYYVTMSVAAQWLDNGYAGWYAANVNSDAEAFDKFLYFKQDLKVTSPDNLQSSAVLDQVGWAALRTGWDKNDTLLEFVSNNTKLAHNHYDQNSIFIGTNNTVIASDPGYRDWSAGPAQDFTVQYGHNTIYVDGKAQNKLGNGSLTKGLLSSVYDYVKGSAAGAYSDPLLTKFDRHIVNIKPGYYVIMDDLAADTPRTYDWMLYAGSPSRFEIDGNAVTPGQSLQGNNIYIQKGGAQMALKFLAPETLPISVQTYAGAEGYGPFVKVGSGTPSSAYKFLTVLKIGQQTESQGIKAVDLGDPIASSGQEYKYVTVSGDMNFFYKASAVNDYFTIGFNLDKTGDYDMSAIFLKSPMYGNVQVFIDGQPAGGIFDGYNSQVVYADEFGLGRIYLTEGSHEIKFQVTGKNDSSGGCYIGLNSLNIVPIDPNGTTQIEKVNIDASLLQAENVIGVSVVNGETNDYILFKTGAADSYTVNNITSNAEQSYVSVASSAYVQSFAMTRGSSLILGGVPLLTGDSAFSAAFGINKTNYNLEGTIEAATQINVGIHTGSQASVTLDGQALTETTFDNATKTIYFTVPAGRHKVVFGDTQAPDLTVSANGSNLNDGATFTDAQPITFNVSASDEFSGVASINTELDGKVIDVSSPVSFTGMPGEHCLTVTAADKAGNTVSNSYKFQIIVSTDSLSQLIVYYKSTGDLKGDLVPQLENSLTQADSQFESGCCEQAKIHMEDFVKHLNNPDLSQCITEAAKKSLDADANWLIGSWSTLNTAKKHGKG